MIAATRPEPTPDATCADDALSSTSSPTAEHHARTRLMRNVSLLGGSQLVTWASALAWTLVVPRRLGASQMGVFTLSLAATGVLLLFVGLGLRPFLVREIAADRSRGPKLLGTAIVLRAALCLPALAAVVLFARLGRLDTDQSIAVLLGWAVCLCYVGSEPILAAFQAIERMRVIVYSTILTSTVFNLGGIALVMFGVRADGLLLAGTVITVVTTALTFVWARGTFSIDLRVTPKDVWRLLVESLPYWSSAAFFTLYLWIDSLMLSLMTPSYVLGWYGLPTRLFGTLMVVPVILSMAWLPQLVRAFQRGRATLYRTARPGIELVLVLGLPICVGAIIVGRPIVLGLFGSGFAGSVPVLMLLAVCVPLMYLNIMANQVMIAAGRQAIWTRVMALACVVNPVANLFLIPYYQRTHGNGAIGAAIAMVITEAVLATVSVALVRQAFDLHSVIRLAKALVATGVMAGVVFVTSRGGFVSSILATAAGVVAFVAASAVLRVLTPEERQMLQGLLTRKLRLPFLRRTSSAVSEIALEG